MCEWHQAIIVGGGPAGLTAGIYLKRTGIDAVLVERALPGGAAIRTERIENYPGFPKGISGTDLIGNMIEQAKYFGLEIREFCEVSAVSLMNDGSFVLASSTAEIGALGVIVATGTEWKQVGIPGEQRFMGQGVSYCATCDAMFFQDQDVAVIGGGDSAIQEALTLANLCRRVFVIHRRDQLRAQKVIQERAFRRGNIEFLWNKIPVEIAGEEQVKYLLLQDTQSGEQMELTVEGVFVFVGFEPKTAFLGNLVDREDGFISVDDDLCTKTKGLFVAGDARSKTLRQIATAVGDGALAAVNLEKHILERQ